MVKKKLPKLLSPYVTNEFSKYVVYYISGSSPMIGLAQDAEIDCFTDDNKRAGGIFFLPDNVPLPQNANTINGIQLYYRTNRFSDVMTILKEEKPLYLCFNKNNLSGYVGTYTEPIGEQEGV
jgi:hypothetical protein